MSEITCIYIRILTHTHQEKQTFGKCDVLVPNLLISEKGQGSRMVKIGPVEEIYERLICFRITFLMIKNTVFHVIDAKPAS